MGWRSDGDDNPIDIEILDSTGSVIAGGSTSSVEPDDQASAEPELRPKREVPTRTVALVALGLAVAIAAVVLLRSTDDDAPAVVLGDPLGILAEDDAPQRPGTSPDDVTFPLFGRSWDYHLIGSSRGQLIAVDLNTGEEVRLGIGETFFQRVQVVDDTVFSFSNQVFRHRRDGVVTVVTSYDRNNSAIGATGSYWFDTGSDDSRVLHHLVTGHEIELEHVINFTAVGDDVFAQLGGRIFRVDADGESVWAHGEILAVGPNHMAWRSCAGLDDCAYWIGTPENPHGFEIPADTSASVLTDDLFGAPFSPGLYSQVELLSPTGRHLWHLEPSRSGLDIELVDLVTGNTLDLQVSNGVLPALSPDESLLISGGVGRTAIVVDTATGDEVRISTSLEPAGFTWAFAAIE